MVTSPLKRGAPEALWPEALWRGAPVVLTALLGVGYAAGTAVIESGSGAGQPQLPHSWLLAALVLGQAALVLARRRAALVVLLGVVALDATMLLVSSGEVGTGTFAVMVAVYAYTRSKRREGTPRRYRVTAAVAAGSVAITIVAVQTSSEVPAEWTLPFALLRGLLAFGTPALIAEIVDGRARLIDALRERAEAAERERERRAEQAVLRERALMARELHDIAAHHLTGIIVSAQAADALRVADPERAGAYIRQVQLDARMTLSNLRQTVGLLRVEAEGEVAPVPAIEQLPALIADASSTGTTVQLTESGTPVGVGPLAGITVYRMVQESLANASRHAPGAPRDVQVAYEHALMRVTVTNGPVATAREPQVLRRDGYGLLGMAERAALIGATLHTGGSPDGGWINVLAVPYDGAPT